MQFNRQGHPTTLLRTGSNAKGTEDRIRPGAFNDQRLPSKLPEAFAMGKPVVLSRSHLGLRAVHRRHAFVLDDATAAPIAAAVRTILQDPALKAGLATGARVFYQAVLRESGERLCSFLRPWRTARLPPAQAQRQSPIPRRRQFLGPEYTADVDAIGSLRLLKAHRPCHPHRSRGSPMNTTAEMLYQKLKTLPPTQLLEVDDFLEFIRQRHDRARQTANQRLGEAMEKLSALDTPPLSAQEIQSEIRAARAEKHPEANARCR